MTRYGSITKNYRLANDNELKLAHFVCAHKLDSDDLPDDVLKHATGEFLTQQERGNVAATSQTWGKQDLLVWFLEVCRDPVPAAYAAGLYYHDVKKSRAEAFQDQHPVFEWDSLAAA